jgi:hypothetical protein
MSKGKIHFMGADPWTLQGKGETSVMRYLGCSNPQSETAIAVHKDNRRITDDRTKVTCAHCRIRFADPSS